MAADRLDDLEAQVTELEATMAGLAEEFGQIRSALDDVAGGRNATGESIDRSADTDDVSTVESFDPPDGASQAAVDDAIETVENQETRRDAEESLLV